MPSAIVIGGSIGGLSAAIALNKSGCQVTVLEKASEVIATTGAGLALDAISVQALSQLGLGQALAGISMPREVEALRWVEGGVKTDIVRNDEHNHTGMHWLDLVRILLEALPKGTVNFGHEVTQIYQDSAGVVVTARTSTHGNSFRDELTFPADVVIAADGVNSFVRHAFAPEDSRRFSGIVAWRGVVDSNSCLELLKELEQDFKELHDAVSMDLAQDNMCLISMLPRNRINWVWLRKSCEPHLRGQSVTVKPDKGERQQLISDAEKLWGLPYAKLIEITPDPFMNVLYDKAPLDSWIYGRVLLIGESAHPTTPHGARSTNMTVQDAAELWRCMCASPHQPLKAFAAFESIRLKQANNEMLASRFLGELRMGMLGVSKKIDWLQADDDTKSLLLISECPRPDFFEHAKEVLQQAEFSCIS